ncbi:phosphoenolpyruvate--protein phosphotransferase [Acidaminobacter sp. JC074]|uniref:phosphoenolpyruvate--protein phosphotransferase n=1 Tax=Acidaminobacter sp. JC074 TaxID=2530199 RepID=UPI001F0F3704|nr:phosphoenolpyruvate--protein phosphotransferase [Acidaminobacter sp. JC074]MCH4887238.1 phosphoenolpyruvate--protein phosphotransferase [Acidaminobacter sp. JC074]
MKGIGASPGYGAGRVFIKRTFEDPNKEMTTDSKLEQTKLTEACHSLMEKLKRIEEKTFNEIGKEESQIFKAHQMMLTDPELLNKIKSLIEDKGYSAAYAIKLVRDDMVMMFESLDNDYMKERAADIKDVCNGLIKLLIGVKDMEVAGDEDLIIVAHDLTPSDTASMDKDKVSGFITAIGGSTSHTAIMSRTLSIPAVVGVSNLFDIIHENDYLLINGETGDIIINPDSKELENFNKSRDAYMQKQNALKNLIGKKSISKDGIQVSLGCNIGQPEDMENVLKNDGEGIGLFRSEFLYMNRDSLPTEEEQYLAYKLVLEQMDGPVVIRTLDVGGDKHLSYLDFPSEENPFLGYRAIRYCLDHEDIFRTQIKALLRASLHGDLKIMFPMISSLQELLKAKALVNDVASQMKEVGDYQVGMMIEIPSAAIISDILAKEVDFFSIGTNDLIQYTTAVDRMNETISDLYTPYHPALLRLIKTVIDNGHKENIWVGMCGEVAGNEDLIPILFAMGLDEFSMSPSSILKSRQIIRSLDKESSQRELASIMRMDKSDDIEDYLKKLNWV